jgi:hypothetical protein
MRTLFLAFLNFYKKIISPVIHSFFPRSGCRFYPTCSEYCFSAIKKRGIFKGAILGLKRILKCNPFNNGGYNP